MGPDATLDFMVRVLALNDGDTDQDHVRLSVDQNPKIPNRQNAVYDGARSPGPILASMAKGRLLAGSPCAA